MVPGFEPCCPQCSNWCRLLDQSGTCGVVGTQMVAILSVLQRQEVQLPMLDLEGSHQRNWRLKLFMPEMVGLPLGEQSRGLRYEQFQIFPPGSVSRFGFPMLASLQTAGKDTSSSFTDFTFLKGLENHLSFSEEGTGVHQ